MSRILVVDDNSIDREHVRRLLGSEHEIIEAAAVHAALGWLEQTSIDCVVLDQRLPDGEGIGLLSRLVERRVPVLMLTAQGDEQLAVRAMKGGAHDYIAKGRLTGEVLQRSVAHAIDRRRLELELNAHQERLAASNKALEEREAQLRVMLAQLPGVTWTTTLDLRYASVAGSALSGLGVSGASLISSEVRAGVPGGVEEATEGREAREQHRRAVAGESVRYMSTVRGRVFECVVEPLRGKNDVICGTIGVALDITEARRLEAELRQSQKMEAVGMLAGGVAHDFNNLLTAILGFAGFVGEALPAEGPVRQDLEQIVIAGNRARKLVDQLLAFSRSQPVEPRVFSVNAVLEEMTAMLRRLLGADIELCLSLSHIAWNVRMDPSGLEQVIANLSINARDAMTGGGRLTLATENLGAHDEILLAGGRRVAAGEHVVIFVSDTGSGIAPELLERIFEPFFTTKEVGRGTGLGLSTCHGIISQAGGTLSVQSRLGAGTTFCIHLPRALGAADRRSEAPAHSVRGGRESILVVEDDDQVRAVIVRTLVGLGYQALEARNGRHALELLIEPTKPIDLVLTDVVMPELGGIELVETLRREKPEIRVLLMSAYGDAALRRHSLSPERSGILQKPVTAHSLATRVRAALDSRGTS